MSLITDFFIPVLLMMIIGLISIQWAFWIFKIGRFKKDVPQKDDPENSPLRYMIANFFVNIINDFRHLLALFIVSIFAITLFVPLFRIPWNNTEEIVNVMQSVSSTFGGIIGAIIGFYFGEKTGLSKSNANSDEIGASSSISIQDDVPDGEEDDIKEVKLPEEPTKGSDEKE